MRASSFFIGPHHTPKAIKILMWVLALSSIFSPIISFFLMHFFKINGPISWFSLSLWGLKKGWVWQLVSYILVQSVHPNISVTLLLSLVFFLFLLWFTGSDIAIRFGVRTFFYFYFATTLIAGLVAALMLYLFSSSLPFYGLAPPIYGLIVLWTMLNPDVNFYFLFFVRLKAKFLAAIILGLALAASLFSLVYFFANLAAMIFAYLMGRWVWRRSLPFSFRKK